MKSTNYYHAFIEVADDCPTQQACIPPDKESGKTIARLQYELLQAAPYYYTSDELLLQVHMLKHGLAEQTKEATRCQLFSKGQPCLRSSPLCKSYGWGIHSDGAARVALYALESPEYQALSLDPALKHLPAMRSRRRATP